MYLRSLFIISLSLSLSLFLFMSACTPKNNSAPSTVVTILDANIPHLDPIHSTNKYSSTINANIFEGLYHYHYLKRPLSLKPQLANGFPTISEDGKTYTIKIKKKVFFQDDKAFLNGKGRELTAHDFIYSWKRLADSKNRALGWWVFDGLIQGLNDWRNGLRSGKTNYATPVSGLTAPDNYTLVIKLTRPSFQFAHFLAMPVTMVVPKEVVDHYGKEIANHPVGTGPYQLESWTRNSEIRLARHPNYRKVFYPMKGSKEDKDRGLLKHAGARLPLSDKIVVKIIVERQPLWLSFLKGQVDHGIIPKDNFQQVFKEHKLNPEFVNKGIRVLRLYRPDVTFIAFNMEHPILGKNKDLRQAMAIALDKKLILEKFYNSRGLSAQGPIPPNLDAYDENYRNELDYNVEKAKERLVKAGYPEGKGLPIFHYELANTGPWSRQYGEFLKDQWAQIGIKIKLVANTWPQFDKKLKNKKATLFHMAWLADYPDSENFLQLFYSKNISPGPNNSNFINRDYDTIYERAVKMPPGPQRNQLFKQLVTIINEQVPSIFLVHRIFGLPYHGWLENYNEYPIIYDYYKYLHVDAKKKAELIKKL